MFSRFRNPFLKNKERCKSRKDMVGRRKRSVRGMGTREGNGANMLKIHWIQAQNFRMKNVV